MENIIKQTETVLQEVRRKLERATDKGIIEILEDLEGKLQEFLIDAKETETAEKNLRKAEEELKKVVI